MQGRIAYVEQEHDAVFLDVWEDLIARIEPSRGSGPIAGSTAGHRSGSRTRTTANRSSSSAKTTPRRERTGTTSARASLLTDGATSPSLPLAADTSPKPTDRQ